MQGEGSNKRWFKREGEDGHGGFCTLRPRIDGFLEHDLYSGEAL